MPPLYHVVRIFARHFKDFLHCLQNNGAYSISCLRVVLSILPSEEVSVKNIRAAESFLMAVLLLLLYSAPLPVRADTSSDPAAILLDGLLSCEEAINLAACGLPSSELGRVYADLLHSHPELFHVALRLTFTSRETVVNGQPQRLVAEVYPSYTVTGQELTAARTLYRDTLSVLLAEMDAAFGDRLPTEAEIVLYIHDQLAHRYAYDTRTQSPNADVHSFLRDGVGICQAYALAFLALARGAGLEADFVASDAMDHAWNHVRVDGVWYHVDVTRDDPIPAREGSDEVNHTRLLRSDEGMNSLGYHGYACVAGHACTDSRFEPEGEAALADFHAPMIPFGTAWVGVREDGAPVMAEIGKEGISTGIEGDMDGDGCVTPADLLTVYDADYPEEWRGWLRFELTGGT